MSKSSKIRRDQKIFLDAVAAKFGADKKFLTRDEITRVCTDAKIKMPWWLINDQRYKTSGGKYTVPTYSEAEGAMTAEEAAFQVSDAELAPVTPQETGAVVIDLTDGNSRNVPNKMGGYVPFGNFNDIKAILASKKFYPVYVTGLSGNGKTVMVEQVCAMLGRELFRVNITAETDEDDLIGGFRLVGGQTVWHDGPVVEAMRRGAVLLLDEVDLGTYKMMCLQPVLEGKAIFIKKTNTVVHPATGFTIVATANTKGKGSDDGRFVGTNVMNEAFLERFSVTMEQEYPPVETEKKILANILNSSGVPDPKFVSVLVRWAEGIRKTFYDGGCDELISTRRLVHICEAYAIFGKDRLKAVKLCLNRFDEDTKASFLDSYKKLDDLENAPEDKPRWTGGNRNQQQAANKPGAPGQKFVPF